MALRSSEAPTDNQLIARVSVKDSGAGIAAADIKKLFGQYVQINAAKLQNGKGSGLGLWLSKTIVEMHGGYVGVESAGEGHGATFFFEIPVYEGVLPSPVDSSLAGVSSPAVSPLAAARKGSVNLFRENVCGCECDCAKRRMLSKASAEKVDVSPVAATGIAGLAEKASNGSAEFIPTAAYEAPITESDRPRVSRAVGEYGSVSGTSPVCAAVASLSSSPLPLPNKAGTTHSVHEVNLETLKASLVSATTTATVMSLVTEYSANAQIGDLKLKILVTDDVSLERKMVQRGKWVGPSRLIVSRWAQSTDCLMFFSLCSNFRITRLNTYNTYPHRLMHAYILIECRDIRVLIHTYIHIHTNIHICLLSCIVIDIYSHIRMLIYVQI